MEDFVKVVGIAVLAIALLGLVSVLSGTILWMIWPVAIPAAFPGLVASGVIAGRLTWWASVCVSWLFGILIKAGSSTTSKKD